MWAWSGEIEGPVVIEKGPAGSIPSPIHRVQPWVQYFTKDIDRQMEHLVGRDLGHIFTKEGIEHKQRKSKKISHFLKGWDLLSVVPKGRTQASGLQGVYFDFTQRRNLSR